MFSSFTGNASFGRAENGVVSSDLLLNWDLLSLNSYGGTGTTLTDLTSNGRNGVIVGGPTYNSEKWFSWTTGDYIRTPNLNGVITAAQEQHSVELWVYPTGNGVLIQYNGQTTPNASYHHSAIEIVSGQVEFGLWGGFGVVSTGGTGTITFNQWHQIVLTYDGSVCRGYVDGEFVGSVNVSWDSPMNGGSAFYMAFGFPDDTSQGDGTRFDGDFRAMRVWGRALTENEIRTNYKAYRWTLPRTLTTFSSTGTFTWTATSGLKQVEYLVVAGGGGGGNGYDNGGGSGGGGGMALTGYLPVTPGTSYTVTVGAGGSGGADTRTNNNGANGGNSVFASITALGGGGGGGSRTGVAGWGAAQVGDTTAPVGGTGFGGGKDGSGGGGATGAGTGTGSSPGTGGAGLVSYIDGGPVTYSVGGNGGYNGGPFNGASGGNNTGNGGNGGSSPSFNSASGGNGGSGIVILKY